MKAGRNDPCPCGSGKKYKKCCLIETYTKIGREDFIRERLVQELLRYFKKHYHDSMEDAQFLFWDDFIPEEHLDDFTLNLAQINFWEWLVYDCLIYEDNSKTLVDLYMENNRRLSLEEHKVLTMMKNSVISLYEVQEVFPEQGLLLKDLLLGREYDVKEKVATRSLRKWDIYAARLLHIDGKYIMSGSAYPYPLKQRERILADIHSEYEDYKQDYKDATMDDFLSKTRDTSLFSIINSF